VPGVLGTLEGEEQPGRSVDGVGRIDPQHFESLCLAFALSPSRA
jgi:hypothetical protein